MPAWLAKAIVNGLLIGLAALSLAPLLWMFAVSLMQPGEASAFPPPLWSSNPTLHNYHELFSRMGMGRYLFNSFLISILVTLIAVLLNTLAGYAFAKLDFPGRERLFRLLLAALVIPAQVSMMPLFLMLKQMGLINSYAGAVVPGMAGIFGIFLVRQYARSIPDELLEAPRIDGAGELRIFFQIVLPALRPILVTLAIFSFLGAWNDFMWPLIVLSDENLQTLPVALASLSREHVQDNEMMMAGSVVTVVPVLLLFLVLQRHYLQGLLVGSVKG
ncbi:carbohydrate ABC transporter permease [Lysobacter sp. ISL-42]|nr:carbohydrate ABC transporter permease [Lysobacter sp. ISL-42]MBT2752806.1 carbohydrate ABC transporter permease [Lysobacter sp. ISL-50]MBT2779394.1 carbohydrate ABC transporter permease [Lysobacter sp. ISL-54]MBT2781843.1 carbohydrate ABC transporter permease [Lysobacter sp. ISL-52]